MLNRKKQKGLGDEIPPDLFHVVIYFLANRSCQENANNFFEFYSERSWKNHRNAVIKNWKVLAWQWIYYGGKFPSE